MTTEWGLSKEGRRYHIVGPDRWALCNPRLWMWNHNIQDPPEEHRCKICMKLEAKKDRRMQDIDEMTTGEIIAYLEKNMLPEGHKILIIRSG